MLKYLDKKIITKVYNNYMLTVLTMLNVKKPNAIVKKYILNVKKPNAIVAKYILNIKKQNTIPKK